MENNVVYVGERYVPKFDGEWSKEKRYEPLIIVNNEGSSYISKTHVPIGVSITNTEYWVMCGEFNPQIQDYQIEVENLHADMEDLLNKLQRINCNIGVNLNMFSGSIHCERYGAVVVVTFDVMMHPNDETINHVFAKPGESYVLTRIPYEYRPDDSFSVYTTLVSGQVCKIGLETTGSTSGMMDVKIIDDKYSGTGLPFEDMDKYRLVYTMCWITSPSRKFNLE